MIEVENILLYALNTMGDIEAEHSHISNTVCTAAIVPGELNGEQTLFCGFSINRFHPSVKKQPMLCAEAALAAVYEVRAELTNEGYKVLT